MDTNASGAAPSTTATTTTTATQSERGREPNAVARSATSPAQECDCVRFGKCKWFNVAKGWGFITPNDGGQEVFVHQSVIKMAGFRSLGEQEDVEFECKETERGLEATRVSGVQGDDCHGSTFRPRKNTKKRFRRVRCYNCGAFANHTAAECALGPQPKRCYHCRGEDHLFVECPNRNVTQTKQSSSDNETESTTQAATAAEPAT